MGVLAEVLARRSTAVAAGMVVVSANPVVVSGGLLLLPSSIGQQRFGEYSWPLSSPLGGIGLVLTDVEESEGAGELLRAMRDGKAVKEQFLS